MDKAFAPYGGIGPSATLPLLDRWRTSTSSWRLAYGPMALVTRSRRVLPRTAMGYGGIGPSATLPLLDRWRTSNGPMALVTRSRRVLPRTAMGYGGIGPSATLPLLDRWRTSTSSWRLAYGPMALVTRSRRVLPRTAMGYGGIGPSATLPLLDRWCHRLDRWGASTSSWRLAYGPMALVTRSRRVLPRTAMGYGGIGPSATLPLLDRWCHRLDRWGASTSSWCLAYGPMALVTRSLEGPVAGC